MILQERLRKHPDYKSKHVMQKDGEEAADELDKLQAENEALRADAERYRWLRDPNCSQGVYIVATQGMDDADKLDAAIDAAMKEHKP